MKALKTATLKSIYSTAVTYDVVAIDEGQFFPDVVEISEKLANEGVVVVIAALDGTFQRKPFGEILSLVPLAEQVVKLSAVCIECGNEAAFTRRTVDSQEVELIGGEEIYKPVCRNCFEPNNKTTRNKNALEEKSLNIITNPELTTVSKNVWQTHNPDWISFNSINCLFFITIFMEGVHGDFDDLLEQQDIFEDKNSALA